jgi:hypothetical protein
LLLIEIKKQELWFDTEYSNWLLDLINTNGNLHIRKKERNNPQKSIFHFNAGGSQFNIFTTGYNYFHRFA